MAKGKAKPAAEVRRETFVQMFDNREKEVRKTFDAGDQRPRDYFLRKHGEAGAATYDEIQKWDRELGDNNRDRKKYIRAGLKLLDTILKLLDTIRIA